MEDETNSLIKYAAIGGALFLVWKNWPSIGPMLGFAPTFTDVPSLQAFCQANPTKSATFNGGTFSCAAWLQELGVSATPGQATPQSGVSGVSQAKPADPAWNPPKPWTPPTGKPTVN